MRQAKWRLGLAALVVCCTAIVICCTAAAVAAVQPAALFCDNMVLQRDAKVPIWGTADKDQSVTVQFSAQRVSVTRKEGQDSSSADAQAQVVTTTAKDGKWIVWLEPLVGGASGELTIVGENTVTIKNVLVGDVWVCSGQSNMQMSVSASLDAEQEIAAADHPNIRLFTVANRIAEAPVDDCQGAWSVCSPQTVPGFSAVGYFFGRCLNRDLGVPIGLINSSWGGTLAEAWTSKPGLETDEDLGAILERRAAGFDLKNPNQASVLYNGMIHPLLPFAIRGAIWYQGESNCSRAEQYRKLFPAMITDWRKQFNQGDFPFLFVQLAPFRYGNADPAQCAELWEAQLKTLSLPNTGMAVTTDIGNPGDIHPKNKQDVGKRLALWALAKTYGEDLVYSGPLYKSMTVEGDKIRIRFNHVGGGLVAKDGEPLSEFTIAGEDQKFVPAVATIEGDSVVVRSDEVPKPVAVRFGWHDTASPNLLNKEGLPASPFRTDAFPMVTAGRK
ncbi:MAG: hypothetical protein A2V70_18230 [Planctomycetes bacterium RBG_13_63_9]|nr:MAG: hypothetical protein A2V70_18230 [Planctomycetes bacterium RBG_13_63_9]